MVRVIKLMVLVHAYCLDGWLEAAREENIIQAIVTTNVRGLIVSIWVSSGEYIEEFVFGAN
jgi:hypothetical protein